jgi:hypothetical protein
MTGVIVSDLDVDLVTADILKFLNLLVKLATRLHDALDCSCLAADHIKNAASRLDVGAKVTSRNMISFVEGRWADAGWAMLPISFCASASEAPAARANGRKRAVRLSSSPAPADVQDERPPA